MSKTSERQRRMLTFIREFLNEHGYPPTIRDIQWGCQISSTSVVDYNLHILQREGFIRRSPEVSRGLELLDGTDPRAGRIGIPVMGYIAAGEPVPIPSTDGWGNTEPLEILEFPRNVARNTRDLYALRVRGLSMIDALIDDGDVVVLQPARMVRNGEMVVAWLQNEKEATLKRFYHEGDRIRLQPANAQMQPIFVDPENVEVQGKVVAVLRHME